MRVNKIHIRGGGSSSEDDILEVLPVLLRYSLLSIAGRHTVLWQTSLDWSLVQTIGINISTAPIPRQLLRLFFCNARN